METVLGFIPNGDNSFSETESIQSSSDVDLPICEET